MRNDADSGNHTSLVGESTCCESMGYPSKCKLQATYRSEVRSQLCISLVLYAAFFLVLPAIGAALGDFSNDGLLLFTGLSYATTHLTAPVQWALIGLVLFPSTFAMVAAGRYQALWRNALEEQMGLQHISLHDHLTDCFNRRYLHDNLIQTEIARARRYRQSLTVIMCDIDHFKGVNDTHGHQAGDAALRHFAAVLKKLTRQNIDSIVRYGGEEFLLILPVTNHEQGAALAERLRSTLCLQSVALNNKASVNMTASFGVASVDFANSVSDFTLDYMIGVADELLYEAKREGRNRVRSVQLPMKVPPTH